MSPNPVSETRWGYARCSTDTQDLAAQRERLTAAGCRRVFEDAGISGSRASRPGLDQLLATAMPGEVVVVTRLDRWGRSLAHLVQSIAELGDREIGFVSLADGIDTSTRSPASTLTLHLLGSIAQFERELISARTRDSLAARRRAGVKLGRPRLLGPDQVNQVTTWLADGRSMAWTASRLGVSRATVYRALAA